MSNLHDFGLSKTFTDMTPKAQETKEKIDEFETLCYKCHQESEKVIHRMGGMTCHSYI